MTAVDRAPEARPIDRRSFALWGLGGTAAAGAALFGSSGAAHASGTPVTAVESVAALRSTAGTADGEVVQLLGYHAAHPGRGGGVLVWDASDDTADDGGLVFSTGSPTGRWRRPVTTDIPVAWFGGIPDPETDQSAAIQAAVDALPDGGRVLFDAGVYRLEETVTVVNAPVTFVGAGVGDGRDGETDAELDLGTQLRIATDGDDAFVLRGVRGGGFRELQMRGDVDAELRPVLTGGAFVRTEPDTENEQNNYFVTFSDCRFKEGYNGLILRACNTVRFLNCVWNGFRGEQVILLNGVGDAQRADPVEFVQCAISAGTRNPGTDNLVLDGLGGSIKFIATAILFGRHGIWMRNTTGSSALPKFLYFTGGGFENSHGVPVLLEAGADAKFTNAYISADGLEDCVRITDGFQGAATFSDVVVRGAGRNGLDIDSSRITITGCIIGNNGRGAHASFAIGLTGATAIAGGARVTTASEHGWEAGDEVTVTGSGSLDGRHRVTATGASTLDLAGADASGVVGGGAVYRHGSGIRLRENVERIVITGNVIGGLGEGVNRQLFGIDDESAGGLVASNDLTGNLAAPARFGGGARFHDNVGITQHDGWLSLRLPGAVANGEYDLDHPLYLDGLRVLVTRVIRRTGAGSARVRLLVDGDPAGSADLQATTATGATTLQAPFPVDGSTTPRRLRLRVANASGAEDLEVQFAYRALG